MPYFDHHHDGRDDYFTSSSSDSEADQHAPRRPAPAVVNTPYDQRRRRSNSRATPDRDVRPPRRRERDERYSKSHDSPPRYDDRRDSQRYRRSPSQVPDERREKRTSRDPEREAERQRRMERRQSRAAEDPEREARRQARRQERRRERAAQHGDREPDFDARRRERRAARRAERNASPQKTPMSEETMIPTEPAIEQPAQTYQTKRNSFEADYLEHKRRSPHLTDEPDYPRYLARNDTWQSSGDDWNADLESSIDEKHGRSRSESMYDELQWYKRGLNPDDRDRYYRDERRDRRSCCAGRRRCCLISLIAAVVILIIIIAVPVAVSRNSYSYTPSTAQVNNTAAFKLGGATQTSVNDTKDGIGAGADTYRYYQGDANQFPNQSTWISFEDMWSNNLATIQQACGWLHYGTDDTQDQIQDIYNAIQDRANSSLVDHRFILAIVMQESHGCVNIPHTTSSGGVRNTGLMQAHDGAEFDSHHGTKSILHMIQDGAQGTDKGEGLVQLLNTYGNPYVVARMYNSGQIATSGDLSDAAGATACYVSDVANRLTGWVQATSTCPGS